MAHIRQLATAAGLVLLLELVVVWLGPGNVQAQEQRGWSPVYQLSSPVAAASEGFMAADPFGNVHVFWTEKDPVTEGSLIMQARFDGEKWSNPMDIYTTVPGESINFVSPFVDQNGVIHLVWSEGSNTYYSRALASATISAQSWKRPLLLYTSSQWVRLQVDSSGVLHVVYSIFYGQNPGVYYVRSEDGGANWTRPFWLDPNIPYGQKPNWLQFGLDDMNGLHVVWNYVNPLDQVGQAVLYVQSLDGGATWSAPLTLDEPDESGTNLRMAHPGMIINGQNLYVIWGSAKPDSSSNDSIYRKFQISFDAGRTWSSPQLQLWRT